MVSEALMLPENGAAFAGVAPVKVFGVPAMAFGMEDF
jgi:hypothetical protein